MKTVTFDETQWRLVPARMTEAMITAWASAPCGEDDSDMHIAYTAMLKAAPTPPADGQSQGERS